MSAEKTSAATERYSDHGSIAWMPGVWIGWGIYGAAVLFIFIYGAVLRFRIPGLPFADPDAWGYLGPAVTALTGHYIHGSRDFLYPTFLQGVLKLAGRFEAITFIQHLLGLLTGVILLVTWERLRVLTHGSFVPVWLHRAIGLLLLAGYLFSNWPILTEEHQIRPEAIFPVWASVNILANLEFIRSLLERKLKASLAFGMCSVFTSILLYYLKPSWVLAMPAACAPAAIAAILGSMRLFQRILLLLVPIAFAILVLWLPERLLRPAHHPDLRPPLTLLTIHANIIAGQLEEDAARNVPAPCSREFELWLAGVLREEMEKSNTLPHPYASLGFDPDYLYYHHESAVAQLQRKFPSDEALAGFCYHMYLRIVEKKPLPLLQKIFNQMRVFYCFQCPAFYALKPAMVLDLYQETHSVIGSRKELAASYPPVQKYASDTEGMGISESDIREPAAVKKIYSCLSHSYVVILALGLAASALILSIGRLRRRYGHLALFCLLLAAYTFFNCLGIATIHTLVIQRYTHLMFSFTLLSYFCFIILLLELLGFAVNCLL